MKEAKDEQYYILIPDPVTDKDIEFDLCRTSNVGLVMRLIQKREDIIGSIGSNFDDIERLRKEHDIPSLSKRSDKLIEEISNIDEDDFESKEAYDNKISEYEDELNKLKDQYPNKLIELQNKTAKQMRKIDRIGTRVCTIILDPVDGIPSEYESKKEYIEEIIANDQDIQDIITFFLNTLNSTMKSRRGSGIQMKKRKNGQKD